MLDGAQQAAPYPIERPSIGSIGGGYVLLASKNHYLQPFLHQVAFAIFLLLYQQV